MRQLFSIILILILASPVTAQIFLDGAAQVDAGVAQTITNGLASTDLVVASTNAAIADAAASNDVLNISITNNTRISTNAEAIATSGTVSNNQLKVEIDALQVLIDALINGTNSLQAAIDALDGVGYDTQSYAFPGGVDQSAASAATITVSNNVLVTDLDGNYNVTSNSWIAPPAGISNITIITGNTWISVLDVVDTILDNAIRTNGINIAATRVSGGRQAGSGFYSGGIAVAHLDFIAGGVEITHVVLQSSGGTEFIGGDRSETFIMVKYKP